MTKYLPADFLNLYIATHTTLTGRDIARPTKKQIADRISTHTSLAGRDAARHHHVSSSEFLLTRPLRDVTALYLFVAFYAQISTHTPLAGRDGGERNHLWGRYDFYSHAPCGT